MNLTAGSRLPVPGIRGFEVMPATVTVVQNWFEELKRLVPVSGRAQSQ
jgi:hypothetical protein